MGQNGAGPEVTWLLCSIILHTMSYNSLEVVTF
jgi:hypothetical protein